MQTNRKLPTSNSLETVSMHFILLLTLEPRVWQSDLVNVVSIKRLLSIYHTLLVYYTILLCAVLNLFKYVRY